ncbi:hypothetical protein BJX64DRAFT_286137 [Aspergillus heterothallicus]
MTTTTQTEVTTDAHTRLLLKALPSSLEPGFLAKYEPLSREQAGHIRHFHNLASQRDGIWGVMGSQDPGQEWVDAYRYQLATMAYASGVAHYHRLPAARSLFKTLLQNLIAKMLKRDVWGYWFLTSHSGIAVDRDIKELRKPWADPIVRENIMYSGHLLLMTSLYTMLFNDDRYNEEGALTFVWDPVFWGMGTETFKYTRQTLQDVVLGEMERQGWLGACCEPNTVFVVCNQFPTNIAESIIVKYTEAWVAKGSYHRDGLMVDWYTVRQKEIMASGGIGSTAWTAAYMNAWNPDFAHRTFETQTTGFLTQVEKNRGNADPNVPSTIAAAAETVRQEYPNGFPKAPYSSPTFGSVAMWVSEVGTKGTLDGLLNHADQYLGPTWQDGGLYYPANDKDTDNEGNWMTMDPFTGNASIGYARLNVSKAPYVDNLDLGTCVDVLRAVWDEERGAMVLTFKTWDGSTNQVRPTYKSLTAGEYGIYQDGDLVGTAIVRGTDDTIELPLQVTGDELTVVVLANKYPPSRL